MDLETLGSRRLNGLSLRGTAFIVAAAALPLAVVFSPSHMALFTAILAVALLPLHAPAIRWSQRGSAPTLVLAVGLLAWAGISTLWAIDPAAAAARFGKLMALAAMAALTASAAMAVAECDRPVLRWSLVAAICLSGGLLVLDFMTGFAVTNWAKALVGGLPRPANAALNRQGTLIAIWVWPTAIALFAANRPRIASATLAAAFVLCWSMTGLAAGVALTAGIAVALLSWYRRVAAGRIAVLVIAAAALTVPISLRHPAVLDAGASRLPEFAYSIKHRLFIWSFTAKRAGERPIAGWGLASVRDLPGSRRLVSETFDLDERAWITDSDRAIFATAHTLPLHPHNGFLQLLSELGIVGVLLMAGLAWRLIGAIDRLAASRTECGCLLGLTVTAVTVSSISYGLWQSWWLSALVAAAAFALASLRPPTRSDIQNRADREDEA